MADKSFGLKQINMIGVGTPTVESSTNLVINTNGSERVRINSSGHVGVGTDNPKAQTWRNGTALDVHGGSGSVVGNLHIGANRGDGVQTVGSLVFYDNTQDTNHKVISIIESDKTGSTSNQRGGTVTVYVKEDATVSNSAVESATFTKDGISFPSGKGIDFSATSDASGKTSELLDDYEEGTFTPHIYFGGSDTGAVYAGQTGNYVKVGRMVTVFVTLSTTTKSSSTGTATLGGLPFTPSNNSLDGYSALASADVANITFTNPFSIRVVGNSTNATFIHSNGSALTNTAFANNSQLIASGSYIV